MTQGKQLHEEEDAASASSRRRNASIVPDPATENGSTANSFGISGAQQRIANRRLARKDESVDGIETENDESGDRKLRMLDHQEKSPKLPAETARAGDSEDPEVVPSPPGAFSVRPRRSSSIDRSEGDDTSVGTNNEDQPGDDVLAATVVEMEDIENQVRDRIIDQAIRASDVAKAPATTEEASKRKRMIIFFFALGLLFLVGGSIAASVASQRATNDFTPSPTTSPTSFSDVVLGLEEKELMVFEALAAISLDDGVALRNVSSAQYQAFLSLARTDTTSLDDEELKTRYGLAVFYYATNGDEWNNNDGWLSWNSSYCTDWFWDDCTLCSSFCDDSGYLRSLRLDDNNLRGTLPPEIAMISPQTMSHVVLSKNANLVSTIPETMIDAFTGLRQLKLDSTSISGTIPSRIGELLQLTTLDLESSRFSGTVPAFLGRLTNLEELNLSLISTLDPSTMPSEVYTLTKLVSLEVEGSGLVGPLISSIGQLSNLEKMSFAENSLTGEIPSEIGQLSLVRALELKGNNFTSTIPSTIDQLVGAIQLFLQNNELTGQIPPTLANMTGLKDFRVNGNQLTGPFPLGMEKMTSMKTINVGSNKLTGRVPFDSIAQWREFKSIRCNGNLFTGPFNPDDSFWQLPDLTTILFRHNLFRGTLPDSIGLSPGLRELDLSSNGLTGSIPTIVGTVTTLQSLDLSDNQLSSTLPSELEGLTRLNELRLDNNVKLSGTVPAGFAQLAGLKAVNVSATGIIGDGPFCFAEELGLPCDSMTCNCCEIDFCASGETVER